MKSSLLNSVLLVGRIILPAILCSLLVLILDKSHWDYHVITTFSLIIILFNYGKTKYNYILSFFISFVLSCCVLILTLAIQAGFGYFIQKDFEKKIAFLYNDIPIKTLFFWFFFTVVSPILMFYSYRILFRIEKTSYFNYIKCISIFLIIIACFGLIKSVSNNVDIHTFMAWQFVMALALQLILYQNELKEMFNKPKN